MDFLVIIYKLFLSLLEKLPVIQGETEKTYITDTNPKKTILEPQ